MAMFVMTGKYTSEALKGISPERTKMATGLMDKYGGKIVDMYATLGKTDLLLIVELPGLEEAMKASIALNKMTGVSFTTAPAVPVEKFDEMAADA